MPGTLRNKVVRLIYAKPSLRGAVLPLLTAAESPSALQRLRKNDLLSLAQGEGAECDGSMTKKQIVEALMLVREALEASGDTLKDDNPPTRQCRDCFDVELLPLVSPQDTISPLAIESAVIHLTDQVTRAEQSRAGMYLQLMPFKPIMFTEAQYFESLRKVIRQWGDEEKRKLQSGSQEGPAPGAPGTTTTTTTTTTTVTTVHS